MAKACPRAARGESGDKAEFARDRADTRKTAKPPRAGAGEAGPMTAGGVVNEGTNKWLTFDLSGLPQAGPLEGRVRLSMPHGARLGEGKSSWKARCKETTTTPTGI